MTLATAEVRWFFPGEVPDDVWQWFRRGDLWATQPERIDAYLVLPGCSTTGIKVREGRFEVKTRTTAPVVAEYSPGVRGHSEGWLKWSRFFGDTESARAFFMSGGERWLSVRKARTMRGFSLDGITAAEDPFEVDMVGDRPIRGCGAEITQAEVGSGPGARWWTIGLEGYGDDADAPAECLERGARVLFAAEPPLPLELSDSRSYAAWLETVAAAC